jgi:hypothetical protein
MVDERRTYAWQMKRKALAATLPHPCGKGCGDLVLPTDP